jgi:hypothetical protein
MIEALIAGERDPRVPAELAKGKPRAKPPQLAEAMAGCSGSHHAVVAPSILDHLDFLDHTIDTLTAQIVARTRSLGRAGRAAGGGARVGPGHHPGDPCRDRR